MAWYRRGNISVSQSEGKRVNDFLQIITSKVMQSSAAN